MKMLLAILSLVSISSTTFAANCDQSALKFAQSVLDLNAKASDFDASYVDESSLVKAHKGVNPALVEYVVTGNIYRATYSVRMTLDSSCGLTSMTIQEQ